MVLKCIIPRIFDLKKNVKTYVQNFAVSIFFCTFKYWKKAQRLFKKISFCLLLKFSLFILFFTQLLGFLLLLVFLLWFMRTRDLLPKAFISIQSYRMIITMRRHGITSNTLRIWNLDEKRQSLKSSKNVIHFNLVTKPPNTWFFSDCTALVLVMRSIQALWAKPSKNKNYLERGSFFYAIEIHYIKTGFSCLAGLEKNLRFSELFFIFN